MYFRWAPPAKVAKILAISTIFRLVVFFLVIRAIGIQKMGTQFKIYSILGNKRTSKSIISPMVRLGIFIFLKIIYIKFPTILNHWIFKKSTSLVCALMSKKENVGKKQINPPIHQAGNFHYFANLSRAFDLRPISQWNLGLNGFLAKRFRFRPFTKNPRVISIHRKIHLMYVYVLRSRMNPKFWNIRTPLVWT